MSLTTRLNIDVIEDGSIPLVKLEEEASLKNPHSLTIQKNGKTLANGVYDGSSAKTVNIVTDTLNGTTLITDATKRNLTTHPTTTNLFTGYWGSNSETDTLGFNTRYGTTLDISYSTWYQRLAFDTSDSNGKKRIEYFCGINTNNADGTEATLTKIGDLAYLSDIPTIPTSLKNPHALTIQNNGTTIDTYDGSTPKTINITVPTSLPANGGNADTVDGKHAKDFVPSLAAVSVNDQKANAIGYTYNDATNGGKHTGGFISASSGGLYGMQINGSYLGDAIAYRGIQNGTFTEWKPLVLKSDLTTELNKYALKTTVPGDAGDWCTPIYISGGKSYTVNAIEDTLIRWKHPDQIGQGTNLQSLFSPIDTSTSLLHSANRLAFGNPDGITVEYSINGGTTWIDYGLTDTQKINLISNQSIGAEIRAGKALSTRATANDKLRITINASRVGFYTSAKALYINFSTNGSENCTLDVERASRGSETNFTVWKTGLILGGWSGWNKLPLGGIAFGGGDNQTSNVGAIRLTISSTGASSSYTRGCHFSVYDLQLIGDTTWTTCSNMGKNGHLYSHDANQNATFPASVTATNDIYGKVIHVSGSANNTTGYISSDANYNMFISQNGLVPFVVDCSNTNAPSIRAGYSLVNTVSLGTSTVPFKQVYAGGFTKKDSSDNYVLLGGGGHKLLSEITSTGSVSWNDITGRPTSLPANGGNADTVDNKHASDFAAAGHAHTVRLSGSITPNITASYSNGVLTLRGAATTVSMIGTSEAEGASPNPESWFVSPDDLAALF